MEIIAKPVEMVAWFTEDGRPNPVRFRFENEDGAFTMFKVDKILYTCTEKLAGNIMLVFRCQSTIGSVEKVFELKYEIRTCRWILFKM